MSSLWGYDHKSCLTWELWLAYHLPVPQEVGVERTKMQSLEAGLRAELLASGHAQATLTQQLQLKVRILAVTSYLWCFHGRRVCRQLNLF